MKILLTGSTGYIGKRLLPLLIQQGHEVLACTRDKGRFEVLESWQGKVQVIEVDFLEEPNLAEFPQEFLSNPIFDLLILEDIDFVNKISFVALNRILLEPNVPEFVLEQTCDRASQKTQLALVRRINTPKKVIHKLAQSQYTDVSEEAQLHINFTNELTDNYVVTAKQLIKNKFDIMAKRDQPIKELLKIAIVVLLPKFFLELLCLNQRGSCTKTLLAITDSQNICPENLSYIAQKNIDKIQEYIENSIRIETDDIKIYSITGNIAKNSRTPPEIIAELANKNWKWLNKWLAANPKISNSILEKLKNGDAQAIAKNQNVSRHKLEELTTYTDKQIAIAQYAAVKLAVEYDCYDYLHKVSNKNETVLRKANELNLSQDRLIFSRVVEDYGEHLDLTPDKLARIAKKYPSVAARCPLSSIDLLCELSQQEEVKVLCALASNPNTPQHILGQLVYKKHSAILSEIVKNTNTPLHLILQPLVNHSKIVECVLYQTTNHNSKSRPIIKQIWRCINTG